MKKIRDLLNANPWAGWVAALLFLGVAVAVYVRASGSSDPYSVEYRSQMVTIKCAETGAEWEMNRGRMERELRMRGGVLSPDEGLINPETGRPTGFPFNRSQWESTIARLNKEREQIRTGELARPSSGG